MKKLTKSLILAIFPLFFVCPQAEAMAAPLFGRFCSFAALGISLGYPIYVGAEKLYKINDTVEEIASSSDAITFDAKQKPKAAEIVFEEAENMDIDPKTVVYKENGHHSSVSNGTTNIVKINPKDPAIQSEDQLRLIVRHELAHCKQQHGIKDILFWLFAPVITEGASKLRKTPAMPPTSRILGAFGRLGLLYAGYFALKRFHEEEADRIAVGSDPALALAGYEFFNEYVPSKGALKDLPFMASHPAPEERAKYHLEWANQLAAELDKKIIL